MVVRDTKTLESLLSTGNGVAARLFVGVYGEPGSYKSRLLLSACEVSEMTPILYITYEPPAPSILDLLKKDNVDMINVPEIARTKGTYNWTMDELLPLISKESDYKTIYFDGICALIMDDAFQEAQKECKAAANAAAARSGGSSSHDAVYPCRQCYGRLSLKGQKFITVVRDLWKQNPDRAAHIFLSFRQKLETVTQGKGPTAITVSNFKPDLPAATLRMFTHELQTYLRFSTSIVNTRERTAGQTRSVAKRQLIVQANRTDEAEARDNTNTLATFTTLTGEDIQFKFLYDRFFPDKKEKEGEVADEFSTDDKEV